MAVLRTNESFFLLKNSQSASLHNSKIGLNILQAIHCRVFYIVEYFDSKMM